jgi:hypothetical protein
MLHDKATGLESVAKLLKRAIDNSDIGDTTPIVIGVGESAIS